MSAVMKLTRKPEAVVSVETITPPKANQYLLLNTTNRKQSDAKIIEYAMAMAEDRWVLNGETIKFDDYGTLIDGQNRLQACVLAEVPFQTYVVRGLSDKRAFATIDVGKTRSHADMMSIAGIENRHNVVSASTLIMQYEDGSLSWNGTSARRYTRSELGKLADKINKMPTRTNNVGKDKLLEWVGHHHDDIQIAVRMAHNSKAKRLASVGTLAAAYYICCKVNKIEADKFMEDLSEGVGLGARDPVHALREKLIANSASKSKLGRFMVFGLILKAMRKRLDGDHCAQLRVLENEAFPKL